MAEITVERRRAVSWSAAVIAGLIGGVFYLRWVMILSPTIGEAPSP
jgi:hypothetical protein